MKKLDRINELVDELNELILSNMASALDSLYHSENFDHLDGVSLLEQVIEPEYQAKTSQRFQNRLKRAHLAGGPQSLDRCKDSSERIYLPPLSGSIFRRISIQPCHHLISSGKASMYVFLARQTAGNRFWQKRLEYKPA